MLNEDISVVVVLWVGLIVSVCELVFDNVTVRLTEGVFDKDGDDDTDDDTDCAFTLINIHRTIKFLIFSINNQL